MSNENQANRVGGWGTYMLKLAGLILVLTLVGGVAFWGFSAADLVPGMVIAAVVPVVGWVLFIMLLGAVTFGDVMERSHARGAQAVADISAATIAGAADMMDSVANVMDAGMRLQREMWDVSAPLDEAALPSPEEAQQFLPTPGGFVDTRRAENGSYEPATANLKQGSER